MANAYLFRQLTHYYNNKWLDVLSKLENAMDATRTVSESAKTVYVLMVDNENILLTSRSSTKEKSKSLNKMRDIIRYKKRYDSKQNVPEIVCEECGEKFKTNGHLMKHNSKVHNQIRFPCPKCPQVLLSKALLETHMVRTHYPKKYRCPKCDKMFSTKNLLSYHDKLYHMAVLCKLCFVQFPSKRDLRAHMNKHDVNNCPRCGKAFYNRQTYKMHLKICGNLEHKKLKFFCDLCSKGYVQKPALRSHLKTDHGFGVNMHYCKYCDKKYDAASKLRNHMVVHTRERKYHCEQCGSKFVTSAALLYHTRLHTGEKPYKCDMCDESFVSASRRMEHKHRKHIGPKKECPICHGKFVLSNQLKKHIKKHSDPSSKLYVMCP
jgi:KRAB domain-containing zinc finger protein